MAVKVRGLLAGDPAVFDLSESKIGDSGAEALDRALVTVSKLLSLPRSSLDPSDTVYDHCHTTIATYMWLTASSNLGLYDLWDVC